MPVKLKKFVMAWKNSHFTSWYSVGCMIWLFKECQCLAIYLLPMSNGYTVCVVSQKPSTETNTWSMTTKGLFDDADVLLYCPSLSWSPSFSVESPVEINPDVNHPQHAWSVISFLRAFWPMPPEVLSDDNTAASTVEEDAPGSGRGGIPSVGGQPSAQPFRCCWGAACRQHRHAQAQ